MVSSSAPCRRGVDDDFSTHESDAILYKAEDIESHPQLGFTSADFAFIALICGGDYSVCVSDSGDLTPDPTTISFQKGLEGFGAKIALQLARSGFGVDLLKELVRPDLISSYEWFDPKKEKRLSTLVILLSYCTVHHSHKQHQRRCQPGGHDFAVTCLFGVPRGSPCS
jgi:hypothetical protein